MMVKFMKENFNNVKDKEKEVLNIQMEINMKEHLKMIKNKAKEFILGAIKRVIRGNMLMIKSMEREFINLQEEIELKKFKEFGKMIRMLNGFMILNEFFNYYNKI